MWLINAHTVKLGHFVSDIPEYVILSHTWSDGEVSFDDIAKPHARDMPGYQKIIQCCAQALNDGFDWAWVDTCCIDKRSSAELSEAINSMYLWYWDSAICYAYLADVPSSGNLLDWQASYISSRWFRRGWTLQELLAPDVVKFYNQDWSFAGTKSSLMGQIHQATQIEKKYLLNREWIEHASIATKFSWASKRETTRAEDMAYCLLGVVQVNMPMLYGEGSRAFYRLQLEIIKQTNEHTIFAWESFDHTSIFAPSPAYFATAAAIHQTQFPAKVAQSTHEVTNNGLNIRLPCITIDQSRMIVILSCANQAGDRIGIWLESHQDGLHRRLPGRRVILSEEEIEDAEMVQLYISTSNRKHDKKTIYACRMRIGHVHDMYRPYGIAVGNRERTTVIQDPIIPSRLNERNAATEASIKYLKEDFVLHEGEFACIWVQDFTRDMEGTVGCALHHGIPWLITRRINNGLGVGSIVTSIENSLGQIERIQQDFANHTRIEPGANNELAFFRDSTISEQYPNGCCLVAEAKKERKDDSLWWVLQWAFVHNPNLLNASEK